MELWFFINITFLKNKIKKNVLITNVLITYNFDTPTTQKETCDTRSSVDRTAVVVEAVQFSMKIFILVYKVMESLKRGH